MKILSLRSTEIFCGLMDLMNGKEKLKITNHPFMPLAMECLGSVYGRMGTLYSLSHYFEQYGNLLQVPEMHFVAVDARTHLNLGFEHVQITPCYFGYSKLEIYQQSILFENGVMQTCDIEMQHSHVEFAAGWLEFIDKNFFLEYHLQHYSEKQAEIIRY